MVVIADISVMCVSVSLFAIVYTCTFPSNLLENLGLYLVYLRIMSEYFYVREVSPCMPPPPINF
jgi:hypothetical protein